MNIKTFKHFTEPFFTAFSQWYVRCHSDFLVEEDQDGERRTLLLIHNNNIIRRVESGR